MPSANPSYVAGGDIAPSRFVKAGSTDFEVLQATANAQILGIAQEGTREAPIPSVSTNLAASDTETLSVYGLTEECLLELGGTVTVGARLKSDANGKGVAAATTGTTAQEYGAIALEGGASGELIRVQVITGNIRPAIS